MFKKDHDTENPSLCPFTRKSCMERACEWWRRTDPSIFESCVIWHIDQSLVTILFGGQ